MFSIRAVGRDLLCIQLRVPGPARPQLRIGSAIRLPLALAWRGSAGGTVVVVFVCLYVRLFVCSFVCSFVCLFVLGRGCRFLPALSMVSSSSKCLVSGSALVCCSWMV